MKAGLQNWSPISWGVAVCTLGSYLALFPSMSNDVSLSEERFGSVFVPAALKLLRNASTSRDPCDAMLACLPEIKREQSQCFIIPSMFTWDSVRNIGFSCCTRANGGVCFERDAATRIQRHLEITQWTWIVFIGSFFIFSCCHDDANETIDHDARENARWTRRWYSNGTSELRNRWLNIIYLLCMNVYRWIRQVFILCTLVLFLFLLLLLFVPFWVFKLMNGVFCSVCFVVLSRGYTLVIRVYACCRFYFLCLYTETLPRSYSVYYGNVTLMLMSVSSVAVVHFSVHKHQRIS